MIITWCQEATHHNHTQVFVCDGTFGFDQVLKFKEYFLYKTSDLKMLSAVRLSLRTNYCNGPSKLSPVSSINRVLGRNSSNSSDPYTKIAEQPKDVVESLAETLELRAAEEQQTLLRERWVWSESWKISWEKGGFDQNPEKYLEKRVGFDQNPEKYLEKRVGWIRTLRNVLIGGLKPWSPGFSLVQLAECWRWG